MQSVRIACACAAALALAQPAAASAGVARPSAPPRAAVTMAPCPDGAPGACTAADSATVYLDGDRSRFALQHELGHLVDAQLLDAGERRAIQRVMGTAGHPWWGSGTGLACRGRVCPSERFADAYATCRLGWDARPRRIGGAWGLSWTVAYGWAPTPRRQRLACAVIARASRDAA